MDNKYLVIDDHNLDIESEDFREIWKERICITIAIILGALLISYRIITDWLPNYLAKQYAIEKNHIKTGCLFQAKAGTVNHIYDVFKIEDSSSYVLITEISIPNTPFYDQKKIVYRYKKKGDCYQVKYIEVDLKIYKKNFIYDVF